MSARSRTAVAVALLFVSACGDGPSGPSGPELVLSVASGDGVFATPGQFVELTASVRRAAEGTAYSGAAVQWLVRSGDAILRPGADAESDAGGRVRAVAEMGSTAGPVVVEVALRDHPTVVATFALTLAAAPELLDLSRARGAAGDTLTLEGRGFSPDRDRNVVLFGGIRGEVLTAAPERLAVRVPPCLAAAELEVDVRFGSLVSRALPFVVDAGGVPSTLAAGGVSDGLRPTAPGCLRLSGDGGDAAYLVVAASTSSVGAARYGATLRGRVDVPATAVLGRGRAPGRVAPDGPGRSWAAAWEEELRRAENRALGRRPPAAEVRVGRGGSYGAGAAGSSGATSSVPAVGDERTFRVLNASRDFDDVSAVVRHVSRHAVFYVDRSAPDGAFGEADLVELGALFDRTIHPAITDRFGSESDLDANDRIVVLFTPTVNALTPRGADGFVAGFFYGVDLLPGQGGSNGGEVFYALVPDPLGRFSDAHTVQEVLRVMPPVLAHEFTHMVHFNQRVLLRGATSSDAVWLSEGVAQMGEEVVARTFAAAGDADHLEMFRNGNRVRARRFLADPSAVSLLIGTGQGSLAERGAGWLFVLWLVDQLGERVLDRLVGTTRTGSANVAAVAGRAFDELLLDWFTALLLDGAVSPPDVGEGLVYRTLDLATLLGPDLGIGTTHVGERAFRDPILLWSSSAAHYIVEPPSGGSVTLRLGGPDEGDAPPGSGFRLRVVRLR
ncbi:MAG: hypothetical protein RJQ04_16470 [Longimicrobiales bacterium]